MHTLNGVQYAHVDHVILFIYQFSQSESPT